MGNYSAIWKVEGLKIDFAFLPNFERKDYAFEGASKIKEIRIVNFGLKQINAITNLENIGFPKLLEKLDLKFSNRFVLP